MRLKYYLRGAGVGIFVTALLMSIFFLVSGGSDLSDEQIAQKAEELGMVWSDDATGSENDSTSTDGTSGDASTSSDGTSSSDSTSSDSTSSDTTSSDASSDSSTASSDSSTSDSEVTLYDSDGNVIDTSEMTTITGEADDATVTTEDGIEYISFSITSGQSSSTVAANLYAAGIIDDASAFDEYLAEAGLDNNLLVGSYAIPSNVTYSELASILTTKSQ